MTSHMCTYRPIILLVLFGKYMIFHIFLFVPKYLFPLLTASLKERVYVRGERIWWSIDRRGGKASR